jgi:hypothetical protein
VFKEKRGQREREEGEGRGRAKWGVDYMAWVLKMLMSDITS